MTGAREMLRVAGEGEQTQMSTQISPMQILHGCRNPMKTPDYTQTEKTNTPKYHSQKAEKESSSSASSTGHAAGTNIVDTQELIIVKNKESRNAKIEDQKIEDTQKIKDTQRSSIVEVKKSKNVKFEEKPEDKKGNKNKS